MKWGYFSDIVQSPFIPFGVESDNADLFKTQNEVPIHTATDISEYNVTHWLSIIEENGMWDKCKFHLLPCDVAVAMKKRKNVWDCVYLSSAMAHHATLNWREAMAEDGKMIIEKAT